METIKTVKQYRTNLIPVRNAANDQQNWLYSNTVYDSHGNILLQETFFSNGKVNEISAYEYDANGRLVNEKCRYGDADHSEQKTYFRNEDGLITKELKYFAEGSFDTITYHYNDQQQLTLKKTINDEQEPEEETIYEYKNGLLTRSATIDGDNELLLEETFEWDDEGRQISTKTFNALTGEDYTMLITYDQAGRKQSETRLDEEGNEILRLDYAYDEVGNPLSVHTEELNKQAVMLFTNDDAGNVILQEEKDDTGQLLVSVKREFDTKNRLLSTEVFIDGQGRSLSTHYVSRYEYEYFET